jgi:acyl carrier protein
MADRFETIKNIVEQQLGADDVPTTRATTLRDDLLADDLDVLEVVIDLESHFLLDIPDEDIDALITVGDLVDYIDRRIEARK